MGLFQPSRDEARRFFFDAWRKYRNAEPLVGAETTLVQILAMHPEYHRMLEDPEASLERDWLPEHGETNPFLHISLHLALVEQVSIDQPPGVRDAVAAIRRACADEHEAMHAAMECLAEEIWHVQRRGTPFDAGRYLDALGRAARPGR